MKHIFQHPPEPETGKRYWRGVGELSDTPEFRDWLEREFPAGTAELKDDEWSRRGFLKLMGASMALAGFGLNSCRRPEAHLVPFTKSAEWTIPGKALYYATAMPRRTGALPLVATTVDGRPIKLEGNPLHPASGGATDVFAQASILDLYDPTRSRRFAQRAEETENGQKVQRLETRERAAFEDYLGKLRTQMQSDQGGGLAFLVEELQSPTRERLRTELEKTYPGMRWCVYDAAASEAQMAATQTAFGANTRLVPRLERADVVLALDSDFLDCGEGDVAGVRAFTSRRRVKESKDNMNRLYVVENRFSLTGSMADHRLRCPASQIPAFAFALARKIADSTTDAGLSAILTTLPPSPGGAVFDDQWIMEAARDLVSKSGTSLVLAGAHQPVAVQLLVYGINAALKNIGQTLLIRDFARNTRTISLLQLADEIVHGKIKQLFILGGDPVYNAMRGLAEDPATKERLEWADLQKKVPDVVRLGYHEDATSALSHWHLPLAHYLESWGDALSADGSYLAVQPMIMPLFGGLSEIDLINMLLGKPRVEGPELVQETFRASGVTGDFQAAWSKLLHDGFAAQPPARERAAALNTAAAGSLGQKLWAASPAPTPESPEIVFVRSYAIDDGRYSNNGWLQELPDPVTKLTWDNAALLSPAMASHLAVQTGDLIRIAVTDVAQDGKGQQIRRELVIAALILPGHADNSITIPLGYGRKMPGFGSLPYAGGAVEDSPMEANQVGFNAYFLRTVSNPHFVIADGKNVASVEVEKAGGTYPLSITQDHWSIEGRGLVREATLDRYREDHDFVKKIAGDDELPAKLPSLYAHPPLNAAQQWGMTVDLNVCTGCSACVIACQAENNIPVVGKLQAGHGRTMHWMRIDRYFASEKGFNQDRREWPEDPEMVHQPMMCQHCENAPCETVCPVNATVHSEDGLNVMAYNRCIGTRYCANNCPFKVRRFNFFDYNQRPVGKLKIAGQFGTYNEYLGPLTSKGAPDIVKLQKNPNVTVRMRGIMEKCTYCVQRIEEAKISAHVRAGASAQTRMPTDSFTSACAQACPNDAIVFGDISDPESRVSKMKAQDRNYRLLEYLNVNTRTSYLARIRNPNPKMPDAQKIGVASPAEHEHGENVEHDSHSD
jgi:molybdopterin-containing oxidoreductase family iron-sulfur binding subunit